MDEYISKTQLLESISTDIAIPHNERCAQLLEAILNAPVVDVEDKWISVNDGLPEIEKEEKHGDHRIQKSVRVLCACKQKSGKVLVKEGYYHIWDWSGKPYWRIPGSIDSVTHWMSLPEPPSLKE